MALVTKGALAGTTPWDFTLKCVEAELFPFLFATDHTDLAGYTLRGALVYWFSVFHPATEIPLLDLPNFKNGRNRKVNTKPLSSAL